MQVDECMLLEWYDVGQHAFALPGEDAPAEAPAARIRLTVCSGFYVRSFAHDLGVACNTVSHMVYLDRTRQANFTVDSSPSFPDTVSAVTYADLEAGEAIWAPKLVPQLQKWVSANPVNVGHVNGREGSMKRKMTQENEPKPRQRFRGEWVAETKKERIKQQGGKFKGKWGRKPKVELDAQVPSAAPTPHTIDTETTLATTESKESI
jgi:tRNA pseudouridine55 synthase